MGVPWSKRMTIMPQSIQIYWHSGIVSSKANMDSKLVQEAMQNIVGVVLERVFAQDR
jgi:hypothetical protein